MARLDLRASFFGGRGFTLYHAWGNNSAIPLSPHFHDEYLICAQLRGQEECEVSGKLQQFSAGDVVLINPQQVHTGNARGESGVEYLSLYVDRSFVRGLSAQLGAPSTSPEFTVIKADHQPALVEKMRLFLEVVRTEHDRTLYPRPESSSDPEIEFPSLALPSHDHHNIHTGDEEPLTLSVDEALTDVVASAFEEFSNMRRPMLRSTHRVGHRKIARAVDYIRDLDTEDPSKVSLDDLADIAGLSKFHFLRQFSQVVGMTPGAYLRTLRLCHAARKLRNSDMPILDVALSVGFADHPSFSRAFARHMGMTPREYQKLGPL